MLYEAFGENPPAFAHVSLLIGEDRQKLSKRHGATSVSLYREMNYLPKALLNYLCLLGWSHPEEKDIFDIEELSKFFNIDRFIKSPSIFDIAKLNHINGQHLRHLPNEKIAEEVDRVLPADNLFHVQSQEWKLACVNLFKEKINFYNEIEEHLKILFETHTANDQDYLDAISWETTPNIREYLQSEVTNIINQGKLFVTEAEYNAWSDHVKKELKIKGKQLFMGMRAVLTHQAHGPDLKYIIPLTPLSVLRERIIS
jgi:glutamyl/glutaminyl-tRNA synthetase